MSGLSSLQFKILKVPISDVSEGLAEGNVHLSFILAKAICFQDLALKTLLFFMAGAKKPIEVIYVSSSKFKENGKCDPLIAVLHGGPHSVSPCSFSRNMAYLSSIGYSQLIVNYRFTYEHTAPNFTSSSTF